MTEPIHFLIYGEPTPQPRVSERGEFKTTKWGGQYKEKFDPAAKKKTDFLLKALVHRPDVPFDCPLQVDIVFWFKRLASHYGRQNGQPYLKPDAPLWYAAKKRDDIDNLTKFVLDALNGEFWIDDGCIAKSSQEKRYTDKLPYTEITIKPL
jgi:Holliday junction resolvase RusA-like endonuclease